MSSTYIDFLNDSFPDLSNYAVNNPEDQNISMLISNVAENKISDKLIVNNDGAIVCETSVTSETKTFNQKKFKKIVLGALFVGTGHPDFDRIGPQLPGSHRENSFSWN